ncbi:hypothetical protein ACVIGB_004291 [Bradyrhizobium sp. USDA 4341]
MFGGPEFEFVGNYRVQSRSRGEESRLIGRWGVPSDGELNNDLVNGSLRRHPLWLGKATVALAAAFVSERHGAFLNEPDVLYKRSHFVPRDTNCAMPFDMVDVGKAASRWVSRRRYLRALLGPSCQAEVEASIGDVRIVAADEYFVHEAGHLLGYDTARKYQDGYFRVAGQTAWPLIYVEEFRADIVSFEFAAELLSGTRAAALFLYNVFLRLGSHIESADKFATEPYGPIPLMLFTMLMGLGWIEPGDRDAAIRLSSLRPDDIVAVMRICAEMGCRLLVAPELELKSSLDVAMNSARYVNRVRSDAAAVAQFERVCTSALSSARAGRGDVRTA